MNYSLHNFGAKGLVTMPIHMIHRDKNWQFVQCQFKQFCAKGLYHCVQMLAPSSYRLVRWQLTNASFCSYAIIHFAISQYQDQICYFLSKHFIFFRYLFEQPTLFKLYQIILIRFIVAHPGFFTKSIFVVIAFRPLPVHPVHPTILILEAKKGEVRIFAFINRI